MSPDATIKTAPVGQHGEGLPESSSINAGAIAWIGFGALIFLILVLAILGAIYSYEVPIKTVPSPQLFPEPRVQTDESAELHQLIEKQKQELETYHWANGQHTLIQIPIERAMSLVAQKGTQAYDPVASIPGALTSPAATAAQAATAPAPRNPPP